MPVFSDPSFVPDIHRELQDVGGKWKISGLKAVAQFAWGVMLRQLSQYPMAAGWFYEPRHEKTCLWGFQPGLTRTGLCKLGISNRARSDIRTFASGIRILWIRKFSRDFYFAIFSFSNYKQVLKFASKH